MGRKRKSKLARKFREHRSSQTWRGMTCNSGSRSLVNTSLNPGWSDQDNKVLKLGLEYWGIGNWRKIHRAHILPGKTVTQLYLQSQRLLKIQSLAAFNKQRIDVDAVCRDHQRMMDNDEVSVKHGMVYNDGAAKTREEVSRRKKEILKKYGIKFNKNRPFFPVDELFSVKKRQRERFEDLQRTFSMPLDLDDSKGFDTKKQRKLLASQESLIEANIENTVRAILAKRGLLKDEGQSFGPTINTKVEGLKHDFVTGKKRKERPVELPPRMTRGQVSRKKKKGKKKRKGSKYATFDEDVDMVGHEEIDDFENVRDGYQVKILRGGYTTRSRKKAKVGPDGREVTTMDDPTTA